MHENPHILRVLVSSLVLDYRYALLACVALV